MQTSRIIQVDREHAPFSSELILKTRKYQFDEQGQRLGRQVGEPVVAVNLQTICLSFYWAILVLLSGIK
jgi:hypothetical protein